MVQVNGTVVECKGGYLHMVDGQSLQGGWASVWGEAGRCRGSFLSMHCYEKGEMAFSCHEPKGQTKRDKNLLCVCDAHICSLFNPIKQICDLWNDPQLLQ